MDSHSTNLSINVQMFISPREFCSCKEFSPFCSLFGTLKAALLKRAAGDFAGRAQGAFHFRLLAIYFLQRDGGCLGVFKFCFLNVH